MSKEIPLTKKGFEKLQAELEMLKGTVRMQIADAIREAKSHGDLRENAAYHEAKLNQSRNDGRIADLENVLQLAKIVERPESSVDTAHLGSRVKLKDLSYGDDLEVALVGSFEADPANDMISIASPLGSALLDKGEGDEIEVEAPAGVQRYKILSVSM